MLNQFRNRNLYAMVALDAMAFAASLLLTYATRFGFAMNDAEWRQVFGVLPWVVAVKAATFVLMGLYRGFWRYTSLADGWRLLKASVLSSLAIVVGLTYINRFEGYPRSVFVADAIFTCFLCGGIRLAIRMYFGFRRRAGHEPARNAQGDRARALIVGAGDAAEKLLREIRDTPTRYKAVCCLDDDRAKWGSLLHDVPIRGPIDRLPLFIRRYEAAEVLIAIPSLPRDRVLPIVEMCRQSNVRCRTLPPLSSIIDGQVSVKSVRDVAIEDLLGRDPVKCDRAPIRKALEGACVLVTGAGGSIGSEIARQAARCRPRRLALFEIAETPLFEIVRELRERHPSLELAPVIGDIRHREVVNRVFDAHRPRFVYHAAAYKHVPLMEEHADEAVLNNVCGTRHLAEAARRAKTERFVLISSDKAVRPGNVMGGTKRLCELLVEAMNGDATEFIAVRFGNVLGSNGSVVPIFQKQIAAGGPITVTDPRMTRFFMTIEEAVHLVLRCSAMSEKRKMYVLDMGTPVRIMDLARNMIRLSGLCEGRDIAIATTGLRPGEKLHEELMACGEDLRTTSVEKVNALERTASPIAPTVFLAIVRCLEQVALSRRPEDTRNLLMKIVALDQEVREHGGDGAAARLLEDARQAVVLEAVPPDRPMG